MVLFPVIPCLRYFALSEIALFDFRVRRKHDDTTNKVREHEIFFTDVIFHRLLKIRNFTWYTLF